MLRFMPRFLITREGNNMARTFETTQKIASIRNYFEQYMKKFGLKSCVIGMSGGIDCALVTALVEPVCKRNKWNLIGVMLPSVTNKVDENNRASHMCQAYCTKTFLHPINDSFAVMRGTLGLSNRPSDAIRAGNIKARLRMIHLYDYAQSEHGIVLSTDNYTELQLGFWTLHGDVGDLGLIQNLWKTEVYEIAKHIVYEMECRFTPPQDKIDALRDCVDAIPTDGLGVSDSDMDQLGAQNYSEVDTILKRFLENKEVDMNHPVIKRHLATAYKRDNPHNMKLPKGWA